MPRSGNATPRSGGSRTPRARWDPALFMHVEYVFNTAEVRAAFEAKDRTELGLNIREVLSLAEQIWGSTYPDYPGVFRDEGRSEERDGLPVRVACGCSLSCASSHIVGHMLHVRVYALSCTCGHWRHVR